MRDDADAQRRERRLPKPHPRLFEADQELGPPHHPEVCRECAQWVAKGWAPHPDNLPQPGPWRLLLDPGARRLHRQIEERQRSGELEIIRSLMERVDRLERRP